MADGNNLWHDVSLGDNVPESLNIIIEIPRGCQNKYEVDKESGLIKLDRVFYTAHAFPVDYGFAPQTYWHDDDPLDVMVLTTYPLEPGVLVEVRPVGMLEMIDSGERDDKILAVPVDDPRFEDIKDISDVNEHKKKEIANFYETYKSLQGKKVECPGWKDRNAALDAVKESVELYNEKFGK